MEPEWDRNMKGRGNERTNLCVRFSSVSGMLGPFRLHRLVSGEAECKWGRFLGEVGHSHKPVAGNWLCSS